MRIQWMLGMFMWLLLCGCAGMTAAGPHPPEAAERPPVAEDERYEEPEYEVVPFTSGNLVRSEDEAQITLANYSYQTLLLALHNQDKVSPEDEEAAERNIEAFNARMRSIHKDLAAQGETIAASALDAYNEFGSLSSEYEDSADMEAVFCGDIISVRLHRSSYTGGAHPNRYTASYLFDLASGQFIDPTQIADDPEAFRTGGAELLLKKAESHAERNAFWEDYPDVIARWNEGAVQFSEEGMTVTYSPYEMGPYSIGEVEFSLSWDELSPLLGESGLARLEGGGLQEAP